MKALLSLLNLGKEELGLVGSMTSLFFLLIFGNLLAVNCGNSLFSVYYGGSTYLPQMYIILSLITGIIAFFMTFFADRFPRIQLMQFLCALMLLFSMVMHQSFPLSGNGSSPELHPFFPLLYLGIQIGWLVSSMQYWLIANDLCDTREAKRLFSLFSVGGILAGGAAGFCAQWVVKMTETINLLLIWSGMLFGAIILLGWIEKSFQQRLKVKGSFQGGNEGQTHWKQLKDGISYLFTDPMLITIAGSSCLIQLLIFNTDYFFIEIMTKGVTSSSEIANTFGWVRFIGSLIALLIQVFITSRLVAFLGVGNTYLLFPLTLIVSFSFLALTFTPQAAMFARLIRIVMVTSLFTAAQNMLYNPLAPEIRGRVRTIISIFFEPLGIGFSGLLFLTLTKVVDGPTLCGISALLAFAALILSLLIKKFYVQSLVRNLDSQRHDLRYEALESLGQERDMIEPLASALNSEDSQIRLNAALALGQSKNPKALPVLINGINDRDTEVRDAVCEAIGKQGGQAILKPLLKQLAVENVKKVKATIIKSISNLESEEVKLILLENLKDPDTRVIANTIEALQNFKDHRNVLETVKPFLNDKNHRVRANTAVLLISSKIREYQGRGTDTLTKMLYNRDKLMRCSALIAFGELNREEYLAFLVNALGDEDQDVRYNSVKAIGKLSSPRAIRDLLEMFNDPSEKVRMETLNTLTRLGDRVVPLLMEIISTETVGKKKILAIESLGKFGKSESIDPLLDLVGSEDEELARAAVNALHGISDPVIIEPLVNHLKIENPRVKAAILSVLGQFENPELTPIFIQHLSFNDDRIRANALDALEKKLNPTHLMDLIPLLEDSSPRVRATTARYLDRLGDPQGRQVLLAMLNHPDKWIKLSAIFSFGEMGHPDFAMLLVEFLSDPDSDIKRNARLALEKIGAKMVLEGKGEGVDAGTFQTLGQYSIEPLMEASLNPDPKKASQALKLLKDLPLIENLDPLVPLLKPETDLEVLLLAIKVFGRFPADRHLEPVLNLLEIKEKKIQMEAVRALRGFDKGMIQGPLSHFSTELAKEIEENQIKFLKVLKSGEDLMIEKVGSSLQEEIELLVKLGLEILGTLHDPKTLMVIEKKLRDPDPRVRANAIEALDSLGDKIIVGSLLKVLETSRDSVQKGNQEGLFNLINHLASEDEPGIREKAFEAMEEIGIQKILLPFLVLDKENRPKTPNKTRYLNRVRHLLELETRLEQLTPLENQLVGVAIQSLEKSRENLLEDWKGILEKSPGGESAKTLLNLTSWVGGKKSIPLLEFYAMNEGTFLREESLKILSELDGEEARTTLVEILKKDPDLKGFLPPQEEI